MLRAINSYQLTAKDVCENVKSLKMVVSAMRPLYCDERHANKLRTSVDPRAARGCGTIPLRWTAFSPQPRNGHDMLRCGSIVVLSSVSTF